MAELNLLCRGYIENYLFSMCRRIRIGCKAGSCFAVAVASIAGGRPCLASCICETILIALVVRQLRRYSYCIDLSFFALSIISFIMLTF